ncbi:hypothetical protein ACQP1V_37205 [Microtetraspora malaysiensis]
MTYVMWSFLARLAHAGDDEAATHQAGGYVGARVKKAGPSV